MGYGDYMDLRVVNSTKKNVKISNATINWGKYYKQGDKNSEMSPSEYIGTTIPPGKSAYICACGEKDTKSGTNGTITFDEDGTGRICWVSFSAPEHGENKFDLHDLDDSKWQVKMPWVGQVNTLQEIGFEIQDKPGRYPAGS
jgi:Aegerolysin